MAKYSRSLWDDFDDEDGGPDETKKSSGPRPNPNYRGNDDAVEDELASDEYGGYGWSGKFSGESSGASYRYDEAFDDSDGRWYRKNSFRYGKHADYSPSSLFRSAFSARYTSYGDDNEAQNKAIRALRNLTRSANTIVDKSTGMKNEFTVQFSSGADSNGARAALNDEKQRVVFVSPDDLLVATTTEAEDAVVDALTGFVLLRVQMAQDVAEDVVTRINRTGAHLAGVKLAAQFAAPGSKDLLSMTPAELSAMSGEAVDEYLAGMLAKSVLMRLARRKVVQNWGGFAPYFIRHAKKFAAVRENLEAAPLSVESVVGRLGYNMLADEEQLALDKEFEDIAAAHLGAEVEVDALLPVCHKLVADIRTAVAARSDAAAGEMEEALNEMLAKAQKAQGASAGRNAALEQFLKQFADGMMGGMMCASEAMDAHEQALTGSESELADSLREAVSAEQLLKLLAKKSAEIEQLLADMAHENAAVAAGARSRLQDMHRDTSRAINGRPNAARGFDALDSGAQLRDLAEACQLHRPKSGDDAAIKAAADALQKKIAALVDAATKKAKTHRENLKAAANKATAKMVERMDTATTGLTTGATELTKALDALKATPATAGLDEALRNHADAVLQNMLYSINTALCKIKDHKQTVEKEAATVGATRAIGPLEKAYRAASGWTNNCLSSIRNVGHHYGHMSYGAPDTLRQLLSALTNISTMLAGGVVAKPENLIADAVQQAVNKRVVGAHGFAAAMARGACSGALGDAVTDDDKEEEEAEASSSRLRVDHSRLAAMQRMIEATAGLDTSPAVELGRKTLEKLQKIQEKSSPVDGELFGSPVTVKTTVLDSAALGRVNDEARNDPEEEYVAYLSHNSAKPKVGTAKEGHSAYRGARVNVVKEVRAQHRGSIERIRNALQFQSGKRTAENYGLRSGDLDEGSLHKLGYDCDNIWSQKTVSKLPDVAVGILVDQSGSMSGSKIEQARAMCIILAEALKKIAGVRLYVYGHTANTGVHDLTIYEHYTPTSSDLTMLGGITSHSNNYDGYAIKDVAKRLSLDPAKRKYLFVIADGLPSGHGYGGTTAEKHVTSVCKFVRDRLKIGLNAFAVGVSGQQAAFKRQYGADHVVFIDDLMTCLPQIVRFLRNTLQKERKLVGLED